MIENIDNEVGASRNTSVLPRFMRSRVLSPVLGLLVGIASLGRPADALAQTIIRQYDQCGQTPGLMDWPANVDVFVTEYLLPNGFVGYRNDFFSADGDCSVEGILPTAPAQPVEQATVSESCPGPLQIKDLRGKGIVSISGVPSQVTGNFDLANQGIFKSILPSLKNVLGDPGAFLADPSNIPAADRASWDNKVKAGNAEYIRRSGPNVNFYDLQKNTDNGVSWNAEKGIYEFRLVLPKHVIVRIDAEEANVFMTSASGDRNVRFEMCQSGANRGVDFGHQTLFVRTPYGQSSVLRIESPTIPGTQVQLFGMEVKDPTAFASAESFMQGVTVRQDRADYPRYFVHTLNMNDLTLASAESPAPRASFQELLKNYAG